MRGQCVYCTPKLGPVIRLSPGEVYRSVSGSRCPLGPYHTDPLFVVCLWRPPAGDARSQCSSGETRPSAQRWVNFSSTPVSSEIRHGVDIRHGLNSLNFEFCVGMAVSSDSSHHPQKVLFAQFSLYRHNSGKAPCIQLSHYSIQLAFVLNTIPQLALACVKMNE